MEINELDQNTILIDSVSKDTVCAEQELGAGSQNKEVLETALNAQARLSPPSIGQAAGEAALKTPKSYFTEVINEYVNRRNLH